MKPHPRIRKTIKWGKYGGAAVTVLIVLLGVIGTEYQCGWITKRGTAGLGACALGGVIFDTPPPGAFPSHGYWQKRSPASPRFMWLPSGHLSPPDATLIVPLWIPFIVIAGATALAWRADTLARRRAKLNLCPKCGYDRTGLAGDAKCPECGLGVASV